MQTLTPYTWEHPLLSLASDARRSAVPAGMPAHDPVLLRLAYQHCEAVTSAYSRTFYQATSLLPRAKRRAVRALYAFCRVSDNIIDHSGDNPEKALEAWRQQALLEAPFPSDPVAIAWADARWRYQIPEQYAEQLLDGVARDLWQARYSTFDELAAYAYSVASTVGLMSMHIIGFASQAVIPYAVKMGVALQLTNILRDVAEDWRAGRLYLPQEEMAAFGVDEGTIAGGQVDDRWRAFMRFQIERNRRLYAESTPGIQLLDKDGRLAVAAAADLYGAILDDIAAHDYDVFHRRAHVGTLGKLLRLPGLWRRYR